MPLIAAAEVPTALGSPKTGPAHLNNLVANLDFIPSQKARDFLYRKVAHEHIAQLFSSASDHSLRGFTTGSSSSISTPICGVL